ncbi:MAG: ComF family protein [Sphingobacteriales bacterium]|nr:MAG: ComF family protein [Sphingobacteriales bacterium]
MPFLQNLRSGARHLLFPRLCCGCQRPMLPEEQLVCMVCNCQLSRVKMHMAAPTETAIRIIGRFPMVRATSFSFFTAGSLIQHVLHQIKYHNRPDLASALGVVFGQELAKTGFLNAIDGLVPVPLHFRKAYQRGYNQSEQLARGIGTATGVPVYPNLLTRTRITETQTAKTAAERIANVQGAFRVRNGTRHQGRHLLLVDDVLTTGATLEACAQALLAAIPDVRISIATAALAAS